MNNQKLPPMIRKSDLKYPGIKGALTHKDMERLGLTYNSMVFEMWLTTSLGWVIPTLLIRKGASRGYADRTYAVTLDGKQCRVGMGPHITAQIRVWITKRNLKRLMPLIQLMASGRVKSNETRDRISTRRMRRDLW